MGCSCSKNIEKDKSQLEWESLPIDHQTAIMWLKKPQTKELVLNITGI